MRNLDQFVCYMLNKLKQHTNYFPGLYAVIACGGQSSRMGIDKSMLLYHEKPQCYWLYEMLEPFCEKVFISCNNVQAGKIHADLSIIPDLAGYSNIGPMACLLSAFDQYPGKDVFVVGCDYPFLSADDILQFLNSFERDKPAAAFYNSIYGLYEPLLAYYNYDSAEEVYKVFLNKEFSLQHFLVKINAEKFFTPNEKAIESVDTKEDYEKALAFIKHSL
jgi:molybdopterin-guanine dinucleotide biosynthesis protein A